MENGTLHDQLIVVICTFCPLMSIHTKRYQWHSWELILFQEDKDQNQLFYNTSALQTTKYFRSTKQTFK